VGDVIRVADPQLGRAERAAVDDVLVSGDLADGEEVRAFEDAFGSFVDAEHAVATANGTAALHATFEALDLPAGATVVTTPFTFVASANAPRFAGLAPRFADVDPETYALDPDAVERVLERDDDVAAILVVHLYGLPADVRRFAELAEAYDVALVEDAAQAHGATVDGRPLGTWSDAVCYSFYPTKNMTTGEGGMVTTDDPALAERLRAFVDHGRAEASYDHATVGHNFRMTNLAAAIGTAQLARLPAYTVARRENAAYLTEALSDAPVETPTEPVGRRHVYHQYTVRSPERDALREHLAARGVEAAVYYPRCVHEQPPYRDARADAPVAERLADEVLSLPVHPQVTEADRETVADAVRSFRGGA